MMRDMTFEEIAFIIFASQLGQGLANEIVFYKSTDDESRVCCIIGRYFVFPAELFEMQPYPIDNMMGCFNEIIAEIKKIIG